MDKKLQKDLEAFRRFWLKADDLYSAARYIKVLEPAFEETREECLSLKQEILCCREALFLAQRNRGTDGFKSTTEYCDMTLDCEREVDANLKKEIAIERKALAAKGQETKNGKD